MLFFIELLFIVKILFLLNLFCILKKFYEIFEKLILWNFCIILFYVVDFFLLVRGKKFIGFGEKKNEKFLFF